MVERNEDDGFLTTLAALKQVIQPAEQLHKQVHVLQKENRTLFEKLENLHQESQEELQTLEQDSHRKLQEQKEEWQHKVHALEEQLQQDLTRFETDLVKTMERIKEMEAEKRLVVERSEEERRELEESMIQLENENKTLKERCIMLEGMGAKLQAELNEKNHAFEKSKEAMSMTRKLLADAESNAAEFNKYKKKARDAQSSASELQYKLQQKEREVSYLEAKAEEQKAEYEAKLAESSSTAEEATKEKLANLHRQLKEKDKMYASLEEQLKTATVDWQKKLSAKDALLDAKEKMHQLVKAKSESLQKKEKALTQQVKQTQDACAEATEKHAAEMVSYKEELDEVKDELKCAEEEVTRCRESQLASSKLQTKLEETERKLVAAKKEAEKQTVERELKLSEHHAKGGNENITKEQLARLQLKVDQKCKSCATLEKQLKAQSLDHQKQLSAKDSLLEAKDKKLKLVTTKNDSMEKNEAAIKQEIQDARAAVDLAKQELDQLKHELKCAEEEVSRCRKEQSSASQIQLREKMAQTSEQEWKLSEDQVQTDDADFAREMLIGLQQQLDEKDKVCAALQEKLQTETVEIKNKLSKKDMLLEAKAKMLMLVTTKSDSLQKNEAALKRAAMEAKTALAEAATKHAAEMDSSKQEFGFIKDDLKCAEEEVSRCRDKLEKFESPVRVVDEGIHSSKGTTEAAVCTTTPSQGLGDPASARKRTAQDDTASESLDAMKANLLAAKSRRSKRKKT